MDVEPEDEAEKFLKLTALSTRPEPLAQNSLQCLDRGVLRQLQAQELQPAQDFVTRETSPAMLDEFVRGESIPKLQHNAGHHQFAPLRVGYSEDCGFAKQTESPHPTAFWRFLIVRESRTRWPLPCLLHITSCNETTSVSAPSAAFSRNFLAHSHWGLLNRFQTRSGRYRLSEVFEAVLTDLQ